jgi:hypothetical protein
VFAADFKIEAVRRMEEQRVLKIPVTEIARLASDRTLPAHERAAAISLLGWPRESPETRRAILALLADPEPEVRAEAVRMPPAEPVPNDPFVNAALERGRTATWRSWASARRAGIPS